MSQPSENEEREPLRSRATIFLLVVTAICFIGQVLADKFLPKFPVDHYFALSLDGIRHGFVWQLLTFQFMHGLMFIDYIPLHILINSWVILIFGRVIETSLGWRRMLKLYFASGVIGGVTQVLGMWIFPSIFGDVFVVGASAGAVGLAAAFSVLYPDEILYLFLPIPLIKVRAASFMSFFITFSAVGIMYPFLQSHVPVKLRSLIDPAFVNVAHAAHLGGLLAGWGLAHWYIRRRRNAPPVIEVTKTDLKATPVGD